MSVDSKDGKSDKPPSLRTPGAKTVVGVPSLGPQPTLDLDMEELSGSLLVEEPVGRGPHIVTPAPRPRPSVLPVPPAPASSRPPTAALPVPKKLAKPLPLPPPPSAPKATPGALDSPRPVARANDSSTPLAPPVSQDSSRAPEPPPSSPDDSELATLLMPSPLAAAAAPAPPAPLAPAPAASPVEAEPRAATAPSSGDVERTTFPRGKFDPTLSALRQAWSSARTALAPAAPAARAPGPFPVRPAVALAAAALALGLATTLFGALRSRRTPADPLSTAPASASGAPSAAARAPSTTEPRALAAPAASSAPAAGRACVVTGPSRVIAPTATLNAGVEARAFGDDIALAFARTDHRAALVRLDAASLTTTDASNVSSLETIRRALPVPGKRGKPSLAVDVDRKNDSLQGRRTLPLDPPLQAGASDGNLAWAAYGHKPGGRLWALQGEGPIEALRGARSETDLSSVAVTFRQANAVWVGTAELKDTLTPRGNLWRLDAGSYIGAPAIAFNDGVVLVAWADRASIDDPWRLRWVRYRGNVETPPGARTFFPPEGGRGEHAMSPGLTAVPGGSFLLVWSEGPTAGHEVRALTLSSDGTELGAPLRISAAGVNAGQGEAAIGSSGRGVVAYLEATATGFQVAATPIQCAP